MRCCTPVARAISVTSILIGLGLFSSCGTGSADENEKLSQITIAPANQSIPKGTTLQLSAKGISAGGVQRALDASVTWQTSQPAVATVDAQGVVTAVAQGVTQISAAYKGTTGSTSVAVGQAALVSITVGLSRSSLPVGESEQLTATGNYSDGSTQNLTPSVTWTSSGPASSGPTIANVNAQGVVTGVALGVVQVSAAYQGVTGSTSLTIGQSVLLSISVGPNQSSLPLGESEQLTATANFSDGTTQNFTPSATWTSSGPAIANVNAQGVVTGISMGTAQLSVVYQGLTGTASITVGPPALLSITVNPAQSSLPVGESAQLAATGSLSDGSTQNLTQSASWSSSGSTIASVSPGGKVIANAAGTATISATAGSVTGSANFTVTSAVAISLNIVPADVSMVLESSVQLQAMATMSDGSTRNMTATVAWSSAQWNIASVSNGGLATANQVGSTTIFAEASGLTGSASLSVIPLMTVSYFNLANAKKSGIDSTIRFSNPGVTSGDLCAMIYVFDRNQEMNECCGCKISDSGLLTLSLVNDLTANTLTGKKPVAGVIEVVPSTPGPNGQCNAGSLAPNGVLAGWGTNVQASNGIYNVTEESYATTQLSNTEQAVLSGECSMMQVLGSGNGICSCGSGD